jgi:ribA/ribD-fused uncharacterized protein
MQPHQTRNTQELIATIAAGHTAKYIFFWGHTPPQDGSTNQSCLSQWFSSPFTVGKHTYRTAEHYMMAAKARLFNDQDILQEILAATNPGAAKALGRQVQNFDHKIWEQHCFHIVTQASFFKFSQNPTLQNYLLTTRGRVLVEASPQDKIWGIGLAGNDPAAEDPKRWQGRNLLGFALMAARQHLLDGTQPQLSES